MLSAVSAQGQGALEADADADAPKNIAESEHFRLDCNAPGHDCGAAGDPALAQHSSGQLDIMEAA